VFVHPNKIVVSRSVVFDEMAYVEHITSRSATYMEQLQQQASDMARKDDDESSSEEEDYNIPSRRELDQTMDRTPQPKTSDFIGYEKKTATKSVQQQFAQAQG
jgi:BRCT domain type II-containing protein